uniref:Uncharacterized protein n=1 Tax=Globisporangium ultimum (strain ATCC 200006 / CBS 805.95 / DAOM BR144) TaxID=431595 RepID=K3WL15_GLOUD
MVEAVQRGNMRILHWQDECYDKNITHLRWSGAQYQDTSTSLSGFTSKYLRVESQILDKGWNSGTHFVLPTCMAMYKSRRLDANRTEGCTSAAMNLAADVGKLDIVQWLHTHRPEGCTRNAMDIAASNGYLHAVKWLHANHKEGCTEYAMDLVAMHGHFEVIKWLHEHRSEGSTEKAMD